MTNITTVSDDISNRNCLENDQNGLKKVYNYSDEEGSEKSDTAKADNGSQPPTFGNLEVVLDPSNNKLVSVSDAHDEETGFYSESDDDSEETSGVVSISEKGIQPTFGNVSVIGSNDVHFGNKTVYQGPVTIKQVLYGNKSADSDGVENPGFVSNCDSDSVRNDVKKNIDEEIGRYKKGHIFCYPTLSSVHGKTIIVTLTGVIIICFITLLAVLLWKHPEYIGIIDGEDMDNNTIPNRLRLVSRLQWLAQPPLSTPNPLKTPVNMVIIHHTATENCTSFAACIFQVRYIQMFHIESMNFWDIGYNFLVGGDGAAYEGRGWTKEGAHLQGWNNKSIGIAFIGTFMKMSPPFRQLDACKKLIQMGIDKGYISPTYKLLGARQLMGTESPGELLYKEIKTWDHWSATP